MIRLTFLIGALMIVSGSAAELETGTVVKGDGGPFQMNTISQVARMGDGRLIGPTDTV